MFGLRFFKVEPTDFVLQFKRGKAVREGAGLSFFYFAPTTSLVLVPVGSVDVPFIFEEVTADFQQVTVQGQITYRIVEPLTIAQLLDFTIEAGTICPIRLRLQATPTFPQIARRSTICSACSGSIVTMTETGTIAANNKTRMN
jgi:hypothetical protein